MTTTVCVIYLAKWLRHNNYTTIPEILRTFTNNNKVVTVFAAIMTIVVPFGWVSSQITAFGNIYSNLTGMAGGVGNVVSTLNAADPDLLSFRGSLSNKIGINAATLWIFAVLPGGVTNQIYFQRVCAIDDERKVNKSLFSMIGNRCIEQQSERLPQRRGRPKKAGTPRQKDNSAPPDYRRG